jgi:flagellar protein FliO/FliZ
MGVYVAETLLTLGCVVGLAFIVVHFARRTGIGGVQGPAELVGRLPLDARRTIYLVKIGTRVLVLGAGEGGLRLLTRIAAEDLPTPDVPRRSFADVLARLRTERSATQPSDQSTAT